MKLERVREIKQHIKMIRAQLINIEYELDLDVHEMVKQKVNEKGGDLEIIKNLLKEKHIHKIEAIKQVRRVTNFGLKEAKDIVDSWCKELSI